MKGCVDAQDAAVTEAGGTGVCSGAERDWGAVEGWSGGNSREKFLGGERYVDWRGKCGDYPSGYGQPCGDGREHHSAGRDPGTKKKRLIMNVVVMSVVLEEQASAILYTASWSVANTSGHVEKLADVPDQEGFGKE